MRINLKKRTVIAVVSIISSTIIRIQPELDNERRDKLYYYK